MAIERPRLYIDGPDQSDPGLARLHRAEIAQAANDLIEISLTGFIGGVTLTPNSPTTTILDSRIRATSEIFFSAKTLNAAQEIPQQSASDGSFTLFHANNSQVDRTYGYIVVFNA